MRYQVVLVPGESGWVIAECPSLPGCYSQGRTREEALDNIQEAMELWLEVEAEKQDGPLPLPVMVELAEIELPRAA